MSDFERGPVQTYEIVWHSGHVERVQAHQVITGGDSDIVREYFGIKSDRQPIVTFHAEINGHWTLTLRAMQADIRTIRLVTADEPIPGGAA
jgi:hypothetical protein